PGAFTVEDLLTYFLILIRIGAVGDPSATLRRRKSGNSGRFERFPVHEQSCREYFCRKTGVMRTFPTPNLQKRPSRRGPAAISPKILTHPSGMSRVRNWL